MFFAATGPSNFPKRKVLCLANTRWVSLCWFLFFSVNSRVSFVRGCALASTWEMIVQWRDELISNNYFVLVCSWKDIGVDAGLCVWFREFQVSNDHRWCLRYRKIDDLFASGGSRSAVEAGLFSILTYLGFVWWQPQRSASIVNSSIDFCLPQSCTPSHSTWSWFGYSLTQGFDIVIVETWRCEQYGP